MSIPATVALLLALTSGCTAYMTQYNKNFTFECPDGHALMTLESTSYANQGDRLWHFDCFSLDDVPLGVCEWSGFVNNLEKDINYKCGNDKVIAGLASNYTSKNRDRRWQFKCCPLGQNYIIHGCDFTPDLNAYYGQLAYTAPDGFLISGIFGVFDYRKRDRVWRVDHCKMDKLSPAVGKRDVPNKTW